MSATRSIRRELVVMLSVGLVAVVAIAALATYHRAREEANELFDYQLRETAASLAGVPLAGAPTVASRDADALVLQVWDRNGVRLYFTPSEDLLPQFAQLGFNTVRTDNGEWRVFSSLAGDRVLQVAQPMSIRRELAASMAARTIAPLFAAVPLIALLVWFGIARGLRPLQELTDAVRTRSPRTLEPVSPAGLPTEVRPLVDALNGLLARVDRAQGAQRAFVADAAHELRTPLTAVHLQAQLAERATDDTARRNALADLKSGLNRATHLVEQLLVLAREESGVAERPLAPVNLAELAKSVAAEHAPEAVERNIDLSVAADAGDIRSAIVTGDAAGLRVLLANLMENAIRYTPSGGHVKVALSRDGDTVALLVRDSGTGIPEGERIRVFDRFYRGATLSASAAAGSGLGLAIVRRIADRHDATIELGPGIASENGEGLTLTVRFSAAIDDERVAASSLSRP